MLATVGSWFNEGTVGETGLWKSQKLLSESVRHSSSTSSEQALSAHPPMLLRQFAFRNLRCPGWRLGFCESASSFNM